MYMVTCIWSENIKFICIRSRNMLKSQSLVGFLVLFFFAGSANEFYIFQQCKYLCLSCNVKKPKTAAKLSKLSRNKHCSNSF